MVACTHQIQIITAVHHQAIVRATILNVDVDPSDVKLFQDLGWVVRCQRLTPPSID